MKTVIISIKFMREKLNNKVKVIKIYFFILKNFFTTNQMLAATNFVHATVYASTTWT